MKRKFKLITTIASLTAAIALLMFGVYAYSGARTINIAGTVGFIAEYVDASVLVKDGTAKTVELLDIAPIADQLGIGAFTTGASAVQTGLEFDLSSPTLNDTTLVYRYTVLVENDGASPIFAKLYVADDLAASTAGLDRTILVQNWDAVEEEYVTVAAYVNGATIEMAVGGSVLLTVTYVVTPAQVESYQIEADDIAVSFALATNVTSLGNMVMA